jgi:hypothetical protein
MIEVYLQALQIQSLQMQDRIAAVPIADWGDVPESVESVS